ncbi:MAG: hypothetical protein Q4P15_08705, partial [Propionibacteriaceae bacterium]|nr:hypothetical protein [Propionibacteriaceae bacterium]
MPPTHAAGTVLPYFVALLVCAIGASVGGMLLKGNDLAIVICALICAAVVMLSYLLPNGPLRRLSGSRWPMLATVATALVVPAAVVLLRNQEGSGYTVAVAAVTALSCAVLLVAAFEVDIEDAVMSCVTLLAGVAILLKGVTALIDSSRLLGVAFLLVGVAVLLWGVTALIDGASIRTLVLLLGVAVLLWGATTLIVYSSLMDVAIL